MSKPEIVKLKIHPLAELMPPMSAAEYEALKADCVSLGVIRDKIVLLDGKILDGRHRYRIHCETGLPFDTEDFNPRRHGPSPVAFVYSKALHRNLTDSQKAAAAVGVLDALETEGAKRKQATQFGGGKNATTAEDGTHVRRLFNGRTWAEWNR